MTDQPLNLRFDQAVLPPQLAWHCEPVHWALDPAKGVLRLWTEANTDYWQRTFYGFSADTGHFLHLEATGDFVLTTKVTSHPCHQYDQAGLMVRLSPSCWVKTSVEFEPDEPNRMGAVVTNGQYSDWSTQPLDHAVTTYWLRVRLLGPDCIVESSLDGEEWQQLRMAHLAEWVEGQPVSCGLYACSPKEAGYQAEFHCLTFEPGRLA
jgi:hypothetical protein